MITNILYVIGKALELSQGRSHARPYTQSSFAIVQPSTLSARSSSAAAAINGSRLSSRPIVSLSTTTSSQGAKAGHKC